MTITTTITHKEERQVNLDLPAFFKEPSTAYTSFIAVLEDNTMMVVKIFSSSALISRESLNDRSAKNEISEAYRSWLPATEEDFMSAYKDARFQTSLEPLLHHRAELSRDEFEASTEDGGQEESYVCLIEKIGLKRKEVNLNGK